MTTLIRLKAQNESRLAEEKRDIDRKRNILILILQHCIEHGYIETAERLQHEAGVSLSKFEVADNIDLLSIIKEYEEYYEMKLGKKPKLVRRLNGDEEKSKNNKKSIAIENRNRRNTYQSSNIPEEAKIENNMALKGIIHNDIAVNTSILSKKKKKNIQQNEENVPEREEDNSNNNNETSSSFDLGITGQKPALVSKRITACGKEFNKTKEEDDDESPPEVFEERLLLPLPSFGNDSELKTLAETISRDIFQRNPNVRWDDVIELNDAKRLLKEAVIMPIKYPELFTGLLSPWCGILLFGPPGTGKTMLAKAVATECRTTFFNISGSTIVSKYRGDSEKLIRMLFELARYHSPSTIFLDEIDSIMGQRGQEQEHEASRRMKTELLIQLDGLTKSNDLVFLLAASNLPWELDSAMLRRLEKKVLVALPGPSAREALIKKLVKPYIDKENSDIDFQQIIKKTEGYSGADIKLVVKEAAMGPMRRLTSKLEGITKDHLDHTKINKQSNDWKDLLEKISMQDFEKSLEKTKPTAHQFSEKYEKWQKEFGST